MSELKQHCCKLEIATKDVIGNMLREYSRLAEDYRLLSAKISELGQTAQRLLGGSSAAYCLEDQLVKSVKYVFRADGEAAKAHADKEFLDALRREAWDALITQSRFRSLVSSNMERDFEEWRKSSSDMPFNAENIGNLFDSLMASKDEVLTQCILNAFDLMTRYHERNRAVLKGFKTNQAWKVGRKVILPGYIDARWSSFSLNHYDWENVRDIDRAMAALNGQLLEDVPVPIWEAVHERCRSGYESGQPFDSTFFTLRAYKSGSLHLVFKDEDLLARFNRAAVQGKNWLPGAGC